MTETIFTDRFMHVDELRRMGGQIRRDGPTGVVTGVPELHAAVITASETYATVALVLAGAAAGGTTRVKRIYEMDRRLPGFQHKMMALGGRIARVTMGAVLEERESAGVRSYGPV